jgi:hypothetical protein
MTDNNDVETVQFVFLTTKAQPPVPKTPERSSL